MGIAPAEYGGKVLPVAKMLSVVLPSKLFKFHNSSKYDNGCKIFVTAKGGRLLKILHRAGSNELKMVKWVFPGDFG